MLNPEFFKTQSVLHRWFVKNHDKLTEQWIGFYKTSSKKETITYAEALDVALDFGWIDGLRKSIDTQSYMIRYTPRKPKSIWSAVNIKRAGELIKLGLMQPAGLKVFAGRDEKKANLYSYERKNASLNKEFEKIFKHNKKAWKWFQSEAPWYRRTSSHWVSSAKQESTRLRRLQTLIADSENGRRIKELIRN